MRLKAFAVTAPLFLSLLAVTPLFPSAQARVTNIKCELVDGLALVPQGEELPVEDQVAKPCKNRRVLILSDATKNDPAFFDEAGKPLKFNCLFIIGTLFQKLGEEVAVLPNDNATYGSTLTKLVEGALPAFEAQCDVTVAIAYRGAAIPPLITKEEFGRALLESNQDIVNKVKPHVDNRTILIGHSQGALQACQLIKGNNTSRTALPAFKLIGLSFLDYRALLDQSSVPLAQEGLLGPTGLTPANLCPQTGVKGVEGKLIPVEYLINTNDEIFGVDPFDDNQLAAGTRISYNSIYGKDSLVAYATGADNTATTFVEGLGLTLEQYKKAFTLIIDDPDQCPTGTTEEEIFAGDSYHQYTLVCGQSPLLKKLRYFDFLADTPWPTIHSNEHNWDFGPIDGGTCFKTLFQTLNRNRIISQAAVHPNGNIYVTAANNFLSANIIEPSEVPPFCHVYRANQVTGESTCAAPDTVGAGGQSLGSGDSQRW